MECKKVLFGERGSDQAVRFLFLCLLTLQSTVYATTSQDDLSLWVYTVNGDDNDPTNANPLTIFTNTTLAFSCYCLDDAINSTWNISFKHNGYQWATGRCFDAKRRFITHELGGEYTCEAHLHGTTIPPSSSPIREISVLNPDELIHASAVQYAVNGSSYSLQCEVDDNYNAVINWMEPGVMFQNRTRDPHDINRVTLQHEGEYTCVVYFPAQDLFSRKTVQLSVVVPPVITHPLPADPVHLTRNQNLSFTIEFNSRFQYNTAVTWFHNNNIITEGITTIFTSNYTGRSTLDLGVVSRSSAGDYRAEVYNNFSAIPPEARTARSLVTLSLTIAPVTPTELKATNLSNSKVQLSWSLADTHADQQPSSLSLLLTNLTHFSSSEMKLRGSVTNQNVVVVPGMRYRAILTSHNQDGEISTLPIEFRAATAPPKVTSMISRRLNMTSFNITMTLAYSGSDTISHFDVQFRERNTSDWSSYYRVEAINGGRMEDGFLWYGIVTHKSLAKPSELSVEVINDANLRSSSQSQEELLVPLSSPSTPTLLSSSHDSLTLSFNLPSKGTPPVLHVIVNFSSPTHSQWECRGVQEKALGEQMECTVPRLSANTQYTLSVFGLGHTGRGTASKPVTFTTATENNSLPAWVIIVVALVVTMSIIIILLGVILVIVHCLKLRQRKRNYKINQKATLGQTRPKQLDPSHAILNRPPPPKTLTRLSDIAPPPISPPSTVTPPPCRSTPSTTVTFKFETTSGSSCSNLDSDISDVHSPSYSYRVTPPPPPSTCPSILQSQQSYNSLSRGYVQQSLHSTRDSLSSCPPAPAHCATNV